MKQVGKEETNISKKKFKLQLEENSSTQLGSAVSSI